MVWARCRSRKYFYRSVRVRGRPCKVYVGCGEAAAAADAEIHQGRLRREERRRNLQALRDGHAALTAPLDALGQAADLLARASLVAEGFHQHHRIWRRKRRIRRDSPDGGAAMSLVVSDG
jgi:hypothetical protein